MDRVNLTALWLWPLLGLFVLLLMSVDNPFRLAVAALMLAAQKPLRRWILTLDLDEPVRVRLRAELWTRNKHRRRAAEPAVSAVSAS